MAFLTPPQSPNRTKRNKSAPNAPARHSALRRTLPEVELDSYKLGILALLSDNKVPDAVVKKIESYIDTKKMHLQQILRQDFLRVTSSKTPKTQKKKNVV